MRIFTRIDRYLIWKFLGTYVFSILLIIAIAVIFDYNDNIDTFTQNNLTFLPLAKYYLQFVPFYANMFSALFVFLSVIFFTSKLAGNSEFIAMIAAGISLRRIWMSYMFCAALIAALNMYLGCNVIPKGSVKRLNFEQRYKHKNSQVKTYADNVQLQVDSGVIAYMEHFDGPSHTGWHFTLDKFENKKLVSHLTAMTAVHDTLSDVRFHWKLSSVTIRELYGLREKIQTLNEVDTIIMMEPQDFLQTAHMQEAMTNAELKDYIERQRLRGGGGFSEFEVEYHKRFSSPFSSFILATIGLSLSARKRKGGTGASIALGILLSVGYIFLQTVFTSFATQAGLYPWLAAWLPNIVYLPVAFYLYKKAPR